MTTLDDRTPPGASEPAPMSAALGLAGRVAVVTGGAQGIGRSLATALAHAGATVVVADLDGGAARSVAAGVNAAGATAVARTVDVADPASVAALAARTVDAHGRLDVLVNNAAVFSTIKMKGFEDIDVAEWRRVLDVNLTGVFLCCQAVAPIMRAQRHGRIINMSSATVLSGRPNYLHYVASKAGVIGITRALAREMGPDGVTVNAIMPGSVATEIERDSVTPAQVEAIVASQAVPRRLTPADLVGAATFLASDGSGAISGQTLVVDGGANFV